MPEKEEYSAELKKISRLLALIATKDLKQQEKISLLNRAGFTPKEIAETIGTTSNTVRVGLVALRKNMSRRQKNKKEG